MPNVASLLKSEIARVARREVRAQTESLKSSSSQYRSHIAALKRQVAALERQVKQLSKGMRKPTAPSTESGDTKVRYSAKRLAAHRAKLGLSAEAYGLLVGVSGQSIYHWEAEKSRPRPSQLQAIAAVRKLGKREATARLEELAG